MAAEPSELAPNFQFVVINNGLNNQRTLRVKIMLPGIEDEVGNFDISGFIPGNGERIIDTKKEPFLNQARTISLGISIDDEYKSKNWSTRMIAFMIESIGDRMSDDQVLFIDTDASEGFWEHIGFLENRHDRRTNRTPDAETVGQGYQKFILFKNLKSYISKKRKRTSGGKRTRIKKNKRYARQSKKRCSRIYL